MLKKQIHDLMLEVTGNGYRNYCEEIKTIDSAKSLLTFQKKYQRILFTHAMNNVTYYNKILSSICPLVDLDDPKMLSKLPLLDKAVIRNQSTLLYSKDLHKRKWHYNSSGGSTGEPVKFIQDSTLNKWTNATLQYYYREILRIDELKVKKVLLWGSERDIFTGSIGTKAKFINYLQNTKLLHSFMMTEAQIKQYVNVINDFRPDLIRGYAGSLYELCDYVQKNGLVIHRPKLVISAAEVLRPEMRQKIESVLSKVYDFYGSRETPAIAGECLCGNMHVFTFNNLFEVLDANNVPVRLGENGKIILTQLHNYAMPLIRYEIGDMAILGSNECPCKNPLPTLTKITGRITDNFKKSDGTIIHGEYFTHLFYLKEWLKSFQVIQEDYKKIRVKISLRSSISELDKKEIEQKILIVMGKDCAIYWEFVDEIPKTISGKHIYTKSLLKK